MDLNVFVFRLLLLFFPGIICCYIIDTFTVHKERTQFQFIINSFLFGLISYIFYWVVVLLCKKIGLNFVSDFVFIKAINDTKENISYKEIIYVCVISILVGLCITSIHTYKLHFRLTQKLRITRKFGELDVWGYLMNSPDTEWVTIRDISNNLMYDGWVQAFSDNSKEAEILLGDVAVYKNDSGEHLYDVDSQYLSLNRENISIEIRHTNMQDINEGKNDQKKFR